MCSPENLTLFSPPSSPSLADPLVHERRCREQGFSFIAGVDEAGRGPLAGPVVAAAVILPEGVLLDGVQDSKKMTARARERGFQVIQARAIATGIGVVSQTEVDQSNILKASLKAMEIAVRALASMPDCLLVDGIHRVPVAIHQLCLPKGDQRSCSISAASVLAKVYRDRMMDAYHRLYPAYGFDRNRGYGTRQHLESLRQYGACPIHRTSFKGVLVP